jgi:hypothetical protein
MGGRGRNLRGNLSLFNTINLVADSISVYLRDDTFFMPVTYVMCNFCTLPLAGDSYVQ